MKYLGSGYLSILFKEKEMYVNTCDIIVIGRRIWRMKLNDFKCIYKKECIFLDTIDVNSISKFSLKLKWIFNIYRIEKAISFRVLKIFCKNLIRVHIPIITDSEAWKKLLVCKNGITINGLPYDSLYKILEMISSKKISKYSSSDLYNLSLNLNMELDSIEVLDCFNSRIVDSVKKT